MGYALEIGAYEPSKLQALLAEIPWSTRFIDDDIMTLYCVLYNVPLYRVHARKGGRQDTPIDRFFRAGLNSRRNREVLRRVGYWVSKLRFGPGPGQTQTMRDG